SADDPDPVGDPLRLGAVDAVAHLGPQVGELGQADIGLGAGGREHAELAGEVGPVEVGVVVLNLVLAHGEHIAAFDVDRLAVGREALKRPRTGEGAGGPPAHGGSVASRGQVENLELEVREGRVQGAEVVTHPVGRGELLLAYEAVDRPGAPELQGCVQITGVDCLEVAFGDVGRRGHRSAAVYAASISCALWPDSVNSGGARRSSPGSGDCGSRCHGPGCRMGTRGPSRPAPGSCSSTPGCTRPDRWPSWNGHSIRCTCAWSMSGWSCALTPTRIIGDRPPRSASA